MSSSDLERASAALQRAIHRLACLGERSIDGDALPAAWAHVQALQAAVGAAALCAALEQAIRENLAPLEHAVSAM